MLIEIKSLQIALQIHCAFPNQACETINILTPAPNFCKIYIFHLIFAVSIGGTYSIYFFSLWKIEIQLSS